MAQKRRPAVLLIGWTGHALKHLRKYGEAYEELGYRPLYYSKHSFHLIGTSRAKEAIYSRDVVDILRTEEPVGVHAISNGGCWVLADALQIGIDEQKRQQQQQQQQQQQPLPSPFPSLQRVVVDSAPGQFYLSDAPQGLAFSWAMADQGPWLRRFAAKSAIVLGSIPLAALGLVYYALTCKFLAKNNMTTRYWGKLLRGTSALGVAAADATEGKGAAAAGGGGCKHLLLFSTDDKLVPATHVRTFGEALRTGKWGDLPSWANAGGADVTLQEWAESEHAGHLRRHPEEYTQVLRDFMRGAAGGGEGDDGMDDDGSTSASASKKTRRGGGGGAGGDGGSKKRN